MGRVEVDFVPVLAREDDEDGDARHGEAIKVCVGRLAQVPLRVAAARGRRVNAAEELHAEEGEDDDEEDEEESEGRDGAQGAEQRLHDLVQPLEAAHHLEHAHEAQEAEGAQHRQVHHAVARKLEGHLHEREGHDEGVEAVECVAEAVGGPHGHELEGDLDGEDEGEYKVDGPENKGLRLWLLVVVAAHGHRVDEDHRHDEVGEPGLRDYRVRPALRRGLSRHVQVHDTVVVLVHVLTRRLAARVGLVFLRLAHV
mmetsp:Transcript_20484/g.64708  ORF Transcript_20484/g.64708 Transcript_20484/m.64708 type:complete len:255 (+) Transcript_20484:444-1208(+)